MTSTAIPAAVATTLNALWQCDTLEKATAFIRTQSSPSVLANYISGSFCAPSAATTSSSPSAPSIPSFDPKTGKVFATLPCTSAAGVEEAVRAARAAFPAWSRTPRQERSRLVRRMGELIADRREVFAVWESLDQGKTLDRARAEIDRAVANFLYFSTFILHEQTAARMMDGMALTYEHRSPAGVFGLISPWNLPMYILTWKLAPCLAFGCCAIAKPSEITSVTAFLLFSLFHQAPFPPGVVNLVLGDGPTTGAALVASPGLAGISFTGSTQTGIAIRRATAHQIGKHLSLELGGKNPTVVFADAVFPPASNAGLREKAIRTAAQAAFSNQGEICLCGSRIYVEKSAYDEFVRAFVEHVRGAWVLGETVGAIVSQTHYNKVRGYLELAEKEGASFVMGDGVPAALGPDGSESGGYWIAPTVLTDVPAESVLWKEEIFGPVVTIGSFEGEAEAVELANDTEYGLTAVVLTADGARMRRVAEQLDAGMLWVNSWGLRELGTPFGGMKNSGVGREGGEYSRDVFTVVRTIHLAGVC